MSTSALSSQAQPSDRSAGLPSTSVPRRVADVGYTMVCFTDLADRLGVSTPLMDAIIKITSVVLGRDLCGEVART